MVQYIKRKCKIKPECLWDVRIYKIVKNVEKNVKNYVKNVNFWSNLLEICGYVQNYTYWQTIE